MVDAVSEFFSMGGYGLYVWLAFGFAALVLIWFAIASVLQARAREREFVRLREIARPGDERKVRTPRTARREPAAVATPEPGKT